MPNSEPSLMTNNLDIPGTYIHKFICSFILYFKTFQTIFFEPVIFLYTSSISPSCAIPKLAPNHDASLFSNYIPTFNQNIYLRFELWNRILWGFYTFLWPEVCTVTTSVIDSIELWLKSCTGMAQGHVDKVPLSFNSIVTPDRNSTFAP